MAGGERVRYCSECKLDVYDFSRVSDEDIRQVVFGRQQRLCARVRQRPDGTMLSQDSHPRFSNAMRRISRVGRIALTAAISVAPALGSPPPMRAEPELFQIQQKLRGLALAVVDIDGALVPKAEVTILNEKTKSEIKGRTDSSGQFRILDLPDGIYEIKIGALGFEPYQQSHVDVPVGAELRVELRRAYFVGEVALVNQPNRFHRFISKVRHIF